MRKLLTPTNRKVWTLALVLSLLFAQFAGQMHRIEHFSLADANAAQPLARTQGDGYGAPAKHSCVAFDAISLACALGMVIVLALVLTGRYALAQDPFPDAAFPPAVRHFLSRAPPSPPL